MVLVKALQLKQGASLTTTLIPLADVASHMLLLGLVVPRLILQAFAPTCTTLIDPP